MCGVGKWLKRWKWQDHSDCPQCGQPEEDVQHVLLCNEISSSLIHQLGDQMINQDCNPEMNAAICSSLKAWHNGSPLPTIVIEKPLLRTSIMQQHSLSWYSFIVGFPSTSWREVQHEHLLYIGSQRSSTLLMTKLVRRIWEIPWSLWEHRNHHLHNDGTSIHRIDYQSIVSEIVHEWNTGLSNLPLKYQHLFHGTLQQHLQENIHLKLMWLTSVWAARGRISRSSNVPVANKRNVTASNFFQR